MANMSMEDLDAIYDGFPPEGFEDFLEDLIDEVDGDAPGSGQM